MNEELIEAVWDCDLSTPHWKLVLVAMAYRADKDGVVDCSISRLIEMTQLSEVAVSNAIKAFAAMGIISTEHGEWRLTLPGPPKTR